MGCLADLERGITPLARSALAVGLAGAAVAAVVAVGAALAWKNRHWGLTGRVYITVVAVTALQFVLFLHHWNLLGFRL